MEDREILEKFCKNPIGINYSETKQAISNILKENENLKQAIKINHDLYETKCNENKELEEQIEDLKDDLYHDGLAHKYLTLKATSVPKSLVKEKIEEYEKLYIDDPEGFRKAHFRVAIVVMKELLRRR